MSEVLENVLFNQGYRRELVGRMQDWASDGQVAKRIADKIMELISQT